MNDCNCPKNGHGHASWCERGSAPAAPPDAAGLVYVLNAAMAMNRYSETMTISRETVRLCRDALAVCTINHTESNQ